MDKDIILNSLHTLIKEVEEEIAIAVLKDQYQSTDRSKYLKIPIREHGEIYVITLRVTLEYEI